MTDPGVISGIKIVRRKFVQLPIEPTREILMFLEGYPIILASSREKTWTEWYAKLLEIGGRK